MAFSTALLGFGTGLSLIVAIGAQNAHVLRQGVLRQHIWVTILICALSDAILILAGIAGIGVLIDKADWILTVSRVGGALFLLTYALFALRRALSPTALRSAGETKASPAFRVALTTLALTWLNPHVYLDTVLLLGSVGNSFGPTRWSFALGAIAASLSWFVALGIGARFLSAVFAKPRAWQVLDLLIGALMIYFATILLLPVLGPHLSTAFH